ncbi:uncharacterized protein BX664DRAFT_268110 [Halteromyces radiatus]|uniref:uncharacterized protein n=1 Tax=Halteromyces radiatus TaxID=101107 RepID=UPI00221FD787|nr:uncharacterized protein BX664DRAFT_268110 [Halteromyces radiatus]KAI8082909.1 hypothetical protein BX664DRAFT_268110 [Halteromyces radiatus]
MFGGQQTNKNINRKQQKVSNLDIDDIEHLLHDSLNDNGDDIDENDFNDPELLAQLQLLASSSQSESKQPTKPKSLAKTSRPTKTADMDIDWDSYASLAQGNDDVHVELNENDLTDPHLLVKNNSIKRLFGIYTNDNETSLNDHDTNMDNNKMDLKEQAKMYQQQALIAKKQGDKKQAVALLRESKRLLQLDSRSEQPSKIPEPSHIAVTSSSVTSMEIASSISVTENEEGAITNDQVKSASATSLSLPDPAAREAQQELLQRVIQLQKEYKDAAHHYKDLGNLMAAKEMIKISKSLLKTGIQLKQQPLQQHEVDSTRKRLPDHPDLSLGDGKLRPVQPLTEFNQPTTEQMEAQLMYQIDICHNLDIQHQPPSNKNTNTSSFNQQQHSALLPLKQAFAADLVTIRALKEQVGANHPMPSLHYEQVDYAYKNILDHLPLNQMELKIIQGTGIQSLDIGTTIEPFVTWDFGGWPPENTAQAHLNKGETTVMKGTEPVFDFTTLIPITRTNRIFMRHLQRKKLTLEVFHNKYNYGFLRRPILIGKVIIPLDVLLTKTFTAGWFDLIDTNRKKTGGKLKIQLGLREPLTGQDIVKRSERWLVMDGLSPQTSQLMYTAGLTQGPYKPTSTSTTVHPSSSSSSLSSLPATTAATTTTVTTTEDISKIPSTDVATLSTSSAITNTDTPGVGDSELEAAEEEINNVDVLVSNMVLEHELTVANQALNTGKSDSRRTKEDWLDRKQALDIKMNMLVIQVQTGMLDMQTYLDNVEKRMNRDRQLALIFKKNHRLDLAKLALGRKKIMQDELDEAKAAMAAQQQEEIEA